MRHGRTDEEWNVLMEAGKRELVRAARRNDLLHYADFNQTIADDAGVRPFDFNHDGERNALGTLLADIVKEDPLHDEFMLSAVVKLAAKDAGPGEGFYKLAEHLDHLEPGATQDEKYLAWSDHVRLAFKHYGASR